ncbi:hypothetical protein QFC20_003927 [Naganishia adeliensis]|uniref:Uncharacterized protein n=1 Tax=Naganishia adeliensis TaxID=92952 RepID=A0ACC2W630_9TREE|nr:hypothetical protein QFC20_003927 [Naganishia adeliensis]
MIGTLQEWFARLAVAAPAAAPASRPIFAGYTLLHMLAQTLLAAVVLALSSTTLAAPVTESIEERQYTYTPSYNWGSSGGVSAATTSGACTKYEVISARGTTESQTAPYGNTATVNGILNQVAGGGRYEVVYPADNNFATGPTIGATDLINYVNGRLASCPSMKFVLIGYSQGAMVTVTAENNAQLPRNAVVATILYGNPYWLPGRPEDAGTATYGRGDASATGTKTPASYQSITKDYCNTGDVICTSTGSIYAHLAYSGSPQQTQAIAFAASQLRAAGI